MLSKHHNLSEEFALYKKTCNQLKQQDLEFHQLWQQFHHIDKEINKTISVITASQLKRQRLKIQDAIYSRLKACA
ncbi:hypothetical protein PsalMR5_00696 [Piscirickettsia salmonis]|uniref:YdcH family protein n=1 Tax=Piscirickettsia salmonis TaxID=1238 RepID=UPI0012BAC039|nr:hypothetical protein [Piscirickettsia salmonis]QGP53290.1 hypothetical protein PsalSR1_00698 [Piscirickettsia salmonis]QGP60789.1 hypothetical protein PsalBI1_03410 [Piscirickettsia salmonis]QGP62855.1 hypothetical protein PsalMR5_00696 [Piscirickettsia salmonis]